MRLLALTACVFLLAADGSALAASGCGKGMLWPYVRNPGDCLTDDEIKAGQRGVYNGPVNINPDIGSLKSETPPAQSTGVSTTTAPPAAGAAPAQSTGVSSTTSPAAAGAPPAPAPAPRVANGAGFTSAPASSGNNVSCRRGYLWPFYRQPGDCLTDAERANGQTGVYRASEVAVAATPASAPASAAAPASPSTTSTGAVASSPPAATPGSDAPPAATQTCSKGLLWPFVRRPGDCPTDVERGRK